MRRKLNEGAPPYEVAKEFPRWNKGRVNGELVILPGLTRRRNDERNLFLLYQDAGLSALIALLIIALVLNK
jgi:GH24 family phage-related lysozyme (muramidase)